MAAVRCGVTRAERQYRGPLQLLIAAFGHWVCVVRDGHATQDKTQELMREHESRNPEPRQLVETLVLCHMHRNRHELRYYEAQAMQ